MPEIRPLRPEDEAAVWELARDFATSFTPERPRFSASYAALLTAEDSLALGAVEPGGIVGYLVAHLHQTLFANAPVVWVEELMVQESVRGRGVGRALMSAAEGRAAAEGAAYVALATRRAGPFYERLGFDESAVFYRKLLAPEPGS
ncbi:GNAT superfamily N-acetyltransferase [Nocardioides thalensis]|uniref:GNAT superfamily N-acetyltransferase n=1 Tax=Nocardioides thalensis TaxID=1914755 RepID=A0A853BYQ9_9ACTN|nr:GNAT superfamily N-acetyltransferase [Nocardioides thalensis]